MDNIELEFFEDKFAWTIGAWGRCGFRSKSKPRASTPSLLKAADQPAEPQQSSAAVGCRLGAVAATVAVIGRAFERPATTFIVGDPSAAV